jgi:hypothetical protein
LDIIYREEHMNKLIPRALTLLIMGALFKEYPSNIFHFDCVTDSLAVRVLREKALGEEFGWG